MSALAIIVTARDGADIARRATACVASAVILRGPASPLAIERIRASLNAHADRVIMPRLSIAAVIARVASEMGLRQSEVCGPGQAQRLMCARCAVTVIAIRAGRALSEIGRAMGGRDRNTIIHQRRKAERLIESDPAFRMVVSRIEAAIAAGEVA